MVPLKMERTEQCNDTSCKKRRVPWIGYWIIGQQCPHVSLYFFLMVSMRREKKVFGGTFSPIFAAVTHAKINPFTVRSLADF